MRKLSRRKREGIGAVVVLVGILAVRRLTGGDESLTLLGGIPFIAFFLRGYVRSCGRENDGALLPALRWQKKAPKFCRELRGPFYHFSQFRR